MDENLLKVGKYDNKFNEILGIEIAEVEIYRSKGLPAHRATRVRPYEVPIK